VLRRLSPPSRHSTDRVSGKAGAIHTSSAWRVCLSGVGECRQNGPSAAAPLHASREVLAHQSAAWVYSERTSLPNPSKAWSSVIG
jgi:hypothetical protein